MNQTFAVVLSATCLLSPVLYGAEPATITISNRVGNRITRFMTGACLEDVNHEVYGGIYSQMLYGESFQEPVPPPAFRWLHGQHRDLSLEEHDRPSRPASAVPRLLVQPFR